MAASDLSDPKAVVRAMREFKRLKRSKFLETYGFGKAKEYMLLDSDTGELYDSKAIVGVAHGYQFPELGPLKSNDFSGGEIQVERKLNSLGFEVVHIGGDWTKAEVEAVVSDYFDMLAVEAMGAAYSKAEHNRALRRRLKSRSKASVELKHQNISAILEELGLPYIQGYKPRDNYQAMLRESVLDFIKRNNSDDATHIIDAAERPPQKSPVPSWASALVEPPEPSASKKEKKGPKVRLPKKLDYAGRDERNRALGKAGEEWVCELERRRLRAEGRSDLAKMVDPIAIRKGDGLGFDVKSYNCDETELFIEVKTTNGGIQTPFIISRNEVEFSAEENKRFRLYRVFNFKTKPQFYILEGDLKKTLHLEVDDYRAFPKGS